MIGGLLIVTAVIFDHSVLVLLNVLISFVCICAIYELFTAININKLILITIPSLIFAGAYPLLSNVLLSQSLVYVYTLYMFIYILFFNKKITLKEFMISYAMTLLITCSLKLFIDIRSSGGELGSFYVILAMMLSWMPDTGAYFFGKIFGKNKLCEKISPKKTVEGAIGGVILSIVSILLVCYLFKDFFFESKNISVNYFLLVFMCVVASLISILGDLSFSFIKRDYHIKDFSNVIPGHGGFLDRFDSVIFVVPFVYLVLNLFSVFN